MVTSILENEHRNHPGYAQYWGCLSSEKQKFLQFLAEGKSHKEARAALSISPRTIDAHRASIMRNLCAR